MLGSDSQVVDALQSGTNLERVLQALGCDTSKDNGSAFEAGGGFIHCPMPDHPDVHESVSVLADMGVLACRSLCGTIRPLDLICAHGAATDRAGAAKWVEELLHLKPAPLPPPVPVVDDPGLTVRQYLAMRGLPASIAEQFGLVDVRCWAAGVEKGTKHVTYETGWYNAVLMPTREGRRPRVRWEVPRQKLRWAPKVRFADGRMEDYSVDTSQAGPAREYPLDLIGMAQFAAAPAGAPRVLMVVEGESDDHAMHAMGLPFVVGVPGTQTVKRLRAELLESALLASIDPATGAQDLAELSVVVWQEPGAAGSQFPKDVAATIADAALEAGLPAPRFATLHHRQVEGAPKDPASMLSDLPLAMAAQRLHDAIMAVLPTAGVASRMEDTASRVPAPSPAQAALDVLQVDGLHTPPPTTGAPLTVDVMLNTPADPDLPAALPPGWSAESVAQAAAETTIVFDVAGNPVTVPAPTWEGGGKARESAPLWEAYDDIEDAPERDLAPPSVDGFNSTFYRATDGWTVAKTDKDGDTTYVSICSAFVVEQVERSSGQILARVAAPFGGAWNRLRFDLSLTADAGRTCAQLASIGVLVANRQRPAVTDLLLALVREREATAGAINVPAGTGWSGRPGTSEFGGMDVEPVNEFGARMYEANQRRRDRRPDTLAAALEWWNEGAQPLLAAQETPTASGAAPLLAIGAAAAAPLVGPLSEVGVSVAPVVWIAGLGGGGKSVTQKLAASIFAPSLPDLDGQIAYFANANISQAALSARVDSCRDLPLILDDVTQLPPLPGSTSRGDAARIEAAAALGMMVFNRKPIERATREGGIRQTRAFRSTAIFSAEVSMSSESSKAVVTAGHRRRIATIEARPMNERGLGQAYAERVNDLSAHVGGAPGELLIGRIREVVAARKLRGMFSALHRRLAAMPEAADVTLTQQQALSVNVLGYALLCEALGFDYDEAVGYALEMLRAYMEAGAGAGGATKDSELTGVEGALRSVEELFGAHPHRFDNTIRGEYDVPVPLQGFLGKKIEALHDGTRRIAMLRPGMEMLNARYGVTMQVIEQAQAEGFCKQSHQFRMSDGTRVRGVLWLLPPARAEDDEPDIDPTLPGPHNTDPHGLAEPVESTRQQQEPLRVPGMGVAAAEEKNMGLLTVVSTHRYVVPAEVQAIFDAMTRQAAASYVFTSGRDAMLHAHATGEGHRTINYQDGDTNMDYRFAWGAGYYVVPSITEFPADKWGDLYETIRADVRQELEALRGHYVAAAEADPAGVLGTPIGVAEFPEADDPRWEKIDTLGMERARDYWKQHFEALYRANHSATPEESRNAHELHVKLQRVHLMARLRHPEWFVVDEQSLV